MDVQRNSQASNINSSYFESLRNKINYAFYCANSFQVVIFVLHLILYHCKRKLFTRIWWINSQNCVVIPSNSNAFASAIRAMLYLPVCFVVLLWLLLIACIKCFFRSEMKCYCTKIDGMFGVDGNWRWFCTAHAACMLVVKFYISIQLDGICEMEIHPCNLLCHVK